MRRWHILETLIDRHKWSKGAEIGVWKGRTFQHLIENCRELHLIGVDAYKPFVNATGETYEEGENGLKWDHKANKKLLLEFCKKHKDRTTFYVMTSAEAATKVEDGSLDFVFVDAGHSYECVLEDLKLWAPKLKPDGVMLGHDYCDEFPGVSKAVNEFYPYPKTIEELEDTVWLVRKGAK